MCLSLISAWCLIACHLVERAFSRSPEVWVSFFSSLCQKNLAIGAEGGEDLLRLTGRRDPVHHGRVREVHDGMSLGCFHVDRLGSRKKWMLGLSWIPPSSLFTQSEPPPPVYGMMLPIFSVGLSSSAKPLCKHPRRDAWGCDSLAILNPSEVTAKITHDNVLYVGQSVVPLGFFISHWNVGILKRKNTWEMLPFDCASFETNCAFWSLRGKNPSV